MGHGRELARAPDVHLDRAHDGRGLPGGVLVRDGPPRELARVAELFLEGEGVHLYDHAVDVVLEAVALLLPLGAEGQHLAEALAEARVGVRPEAPAAHLLERFPLAADHHPCGLRHGVHVDEEAALGHHARVQALHRARGHVAWVGVRFLLALLALAVDRIEACPRQEDLAPRLEPAGYVWPVQGQRHRLDRAHVRRHVVAPDPVAAGHAPHETSLLIMEGHRQAVDLRLGHVVDGALADLAEDPLLELPQLLFVVGVVEAEHRHPVRPRRKRRRRLFADALGGAVGGDEVGELRLQVPQLALEAVVLRVGDLRPVEHVVEVLVPAQLAPQLLDAALSLIAGQ